MGFGENGNMGPADFAAMTGNGGFGGFAGDGAWWIIILFLFCFMGNGWGNGYGGGGNGLPLMMGQADAGVQRGFDQAAIMGGIQGVQSAVTTGFGDTALGLANLSQSVMAQGYQGQIATLQGFNNMQSQFANCCCENRLGIANLGADIAREACADRQAVSEAMMGLTAQNNMNTNTIVNAINNGVQSIKDIQIQAQLAAKDDIIAQLRSENLYARGQASQDLQTGVIQAGQRALANEIEQYIRPQINPAYVVPNPYAGTNNTGCCYGTA